MKATEEQISDWKKKHGDIFEITVEDESCIVRKPTRTELSYATTVATKDPLKFNELLLKSCWLGGDEEIKTNDAYFMGACSQLESLIEVKKAEIKKL